MATVIVVLGLLIAAGGVSLYVWATNRRYARIDAEINKILAETRPWTRNPQPAPPKEKP